MPTETDLSAPVPPPDAGLPTRGPGPSEQGPRRSGDDLIAAAAKGEALEGDEAADLLEYYVANGQLPGDDKPYPIELETGVGRHIKKSTWQFRRIGWDEWSDAESRGRNDITGAFDGYVVASFVVARALVKPELGPIVLRQQQEAQASSDGKINGRDENGNKVRLDPPEDAAHFLRRMFKKQGGTLLSVSASVRRISRLGTDQESSRVLDEEVAAGEA